MSLFDPAAGTWHLPALVNEVADVTGAGDTVAASLAIGLGNGLTLRDAAQRRQYRRQRRRLPPWDLGGGGEELLEAGLASISRWNRRLRHEPRFVPRSRRHHHRRSRYIRAIRHWSGCFPARPKPSPDLAREGWKLIVISNQSGVGRGLIALDEMRAVEARFEELMRRPGRRLTPLISACTRRRALPLPQALSAACAAGRARTFHRSRGILYDRRPRGRYSVRQECRLLRPFGCVTASFPSPNDLPDFVAPDWSAIYQKLTARSGVQLPPCGGLSDRAYRCP